MFYIQFNAEILNIHFDDFWQLCDNPDNRDGVVTHLEPDILEYEFKWALGRITMNKASGGEVMEFQLSYFKS